MSDPTITVTNLGDLGVDSVFGVIYPPQVALVGFGRVAERPWAVDGMVGVRSCTTAYAFCRPPRQRRPPRWSVSWARSIGCCNTRRSYD